MIKKITPITLFFLLSLFFCSPKRIKIYEVPMGIRENIVIFALSLQGAKYKMGGKGPSVFDCSGFVYYVYKRFGISLPLETEAQLKSGYEIAQEEILPADLVFFKIRKDLHVGIMITKSDFIHASKSSGVAISSLRDPYWRKTFLTLRRVL